MSLHKQYNELEKDEKELFIEAHGPKTMRVGETLVRRYRALYNEHLKTWVMPSLSELNLITRKGKFIGFQKNWAERVKLAEQSTLLDNKSKQNGQLRF